MKVLIEINEKTFKDLHGLVAINFGRCCGKTIMDECLKAISKGTPISNDATNKDVIRIMFPNGFSAKKSWWDAQYKNGVKGRPII